MSKSERKTAGSAKHASGEYLRVGELAKAVGKTVRAMHLYEELGLLRPAMRTEGGFRLYAPEAVARISWIIKLQAIGFKLSEIQGFVQDFEDSPSGREATSRAREVFAAKLRETRDQLARLEVIERDLVEALAYLDACGCSPTLAPAQCKTCEYAGHEVDAVPTLFAGLSRTAGEGYEVAVTADRLGTNDEGKS
jgi:DNA-binding transcriptional MerR regulator